MKYESVFESNFASILFLSNAKAKRISWNLKNLANTHKEQRLQYLLR